MAGAERLGKAVWGAARTGRQGCVGPGMARLGWARPGKVWQVRLGRAVQRGSALGVAWQARNNAAWPGEVRLGPAGKAGFGMVRLGGAGVEGRARAGEERRGRLG